MAHWEPCGYVCKQGSGFSSPHVSGYPVTRTWLPFLTPYVELSYLRVFMCFQKMLFGGCLYKFLISSQCEATYPKPLLSERSFFLTEAAHLPSFTALWPWSKVILPVALGDCVPALLRLKEEHLGCQSGPWMPRSTIGSFLSCRAFQNDILVTCLCTVI